MASVAKLARQRRQRRHQRIRNRIVGTAQRPHTVAAASSLEGPVRSAGTKVEKARSVGQLAAERAKVLGITRVVFDRGGYLYHGRVKAVADGARAGGLEF